VEIPLARQADPFIGCSRLDASGVKETGFELCAEGDWFRTAGCAGPRG
jgi:hypothetical protein